MKTMEQPNKEPKLGEGLIPQLLRKWAYQKRFTKKQKEELQKIKANAYMSEARKVAKEQGKKDAQKDFGEGGMNNNG